MKSFKYILLGRPVNLDDYIDLSRRIKPDSASIELATEEIIHAQSICKKMIGKFLLDLKGYPLRFEKVLGACHSDESIKKQRSCIDNANRNLSRYMEKVQTLGVEIKGLDKRFDYSIVFDLRVVSHTAKNVFIPY